MKTIRMIVWLVLPITSCLALPPSQQEHARNSVRTKQQTTATLPNRMTSGVTSTTLASITSTSSLINLNHVSSSTSPTTVNNTTITTTNITTTTNPTPISSSSSFVTTTSATSSSSSANPIVSVASTEQIMSRTAATSGSGSTVFLSSTRKVSTKLDEPISSTIPSTSGKETRESPGKIRPQIKLTTNYTSASEVSIFFFLFLFCLFV
ncbi:hypothetical protein M0804_015595 [Polistes exclamans]|nr:hypothetical protein M0804_015597 [Polistes exclamans]KAI4472815.1 hypothetical protein M0804_015595 [Polistes exclamans]